MNPNPDSPAYPTKMYTGLTKRELIAAMALQGLLSDPSVVGPTETLAQDATRIADALLKELAK